MLTEGRSLTGSWTPLPLVDSPSPPSALPPPTIPVRPNACSFVPGPLTARPVGNECCECRRRSSASWELALFVDVRRAHPFFPIHSAVCLLQTAPMRSPTEEDSLLPRPTVPSHARVTRQRSAEGELDPSQSWPRSDERDPS